MKPLKTGIFGGTLDPIHNGHLRSAEEVREAFGLAEVWFIPSARPPHKDAPCISPFSHRLKMADIAIRENPAFRVVDLEARRSGPSYSIDTLRELHEIHGEDRCFFFIMGADAFLEIEKWKEYRKLIDFCSIIIMSRDNALKDDAAGVVSRVWPHIRLDEQATADNFALGSVLFHRVTRLEISATSIRKKIKEGKSIRYLVPEKVREYMETNRLYMDQESDLANVSTHQPQSTIKEPDAGSERAVEIARAIHDNKGEDIIILDIRGMSAFADFFVIAHGRSTRHVEGMTSKIRRGLRDKKIKCKGIEGETEAKWVLMDYDDCIVHLFYEPVRKFYDLEGLWADAPRIAWQESPSLPDQ